MLQRGQGMTQRIARFDTNGDSRLSKDEVPEQMKQKLKQYDTNKDGLLYKKELAAIGSQRW